MTMHRRSFIFDDLPVRRSRTSFAEEAQLADTLQFLLNYGSSAQVDDVLMHEAAQFAAEEDNVECLQILLKHGMCATNPPNIDELEEQSEYETQKYCWQILFAAGSHLGFCPFMDYIKHNSNHDYFSLLHLCRTTLRKHLLRCSPSNNLFCLIPRLDIPERLKSYLLYNMSLENENLIAPCVRTESPQGKRSRPLRRNRDPPHKLAFDENLTNKNNSRKANNDTLEKEIKLTKNEVEQCLVKKKRQVADDLSLKEKR